MTGSEPAHASRTEPRRGGLEVWAPSVTPPIGIDLTDEQARLHTEAFDQSQDEIGRAHV